MLRVHSISETSYSNLTYSLSDRKRKMNIVLLTFNLTDEDYLRQFNSHILRNLKKLKRFRNSRELPEFYLLKSSLPDYNIQF